MYTIQLYKKVDAQETYENVRWFTSLSKQESYFNGLSKETINNCTPLLNNNAFKCRGNVNDYRTFSYMRYWFTNASGKKKKVIYCFIEDMEYVNEEVFLLHYKIDAFQTYMTEIDIKDSFIEREHATDLGKYVDEGLEVGEMICNSKYVAPTGGFELYYAICSTVDPANPDTDIARSGVYGGVPYCAPIFAYTLSEYQTTVGNIISEGKSDAIVATFAIPSTFVKYKGTPYLSHEIEESAEPYQAEITVPKITSLNGYTPVNSKLLTSPYVKYKITNMQGSASYMNLEQFSSSGNNVTFVFSYSPIQGSQATIHPKNYNNQIDAYDHAIGSMQYASGAWVTDPYQTYLAQNTRSDLIGLASTLGSTSVNALVTGATTALSTGNPLIGVASGLGIGAMGLISGGANLMSKTTNAEDQVLKANGTTTSGPILGPIIGHSFEIELLTCRKDVAESIDAYFTAFGYKVNRFGTPQLNSRSDFNYIKLVKPCIVGAIPHNYLNQIIKAFENGVRLWHKSFTE